MSRTRKSDVPGDREIADISGSIQAHDPDGSGLVRALMRLPSFDGAINGRTTRGTLIGYTAAVAMSIIALFVRFMLDPVLPPGFPYLTFFPAVIVTGFIWGVLPAVLSAALSGLFAWYWFIPPYGGFAIDVRSITALVFYVIVVAVDLGLLKLALYTAASQAKAHRALAAALETQEVVSQEVDHRLKNLLATVSGLISLSQKHAASPAELGSQLRERVNAMSHSVTLLRSSVDRTTTGVRDVIVSTLGPLGISPGERLVLEGDESILDHNGIVSLNLIIHELGTNAMKYGAFSSDTGTVHVAWKATAAAGHHHALTLSWAEVDGPQVTAPTRRGFGSELLCRTARSLGGECVFEFAATGLVVRISMNCVCRPLTSPVRTARPLSVSS